MSRFTQTTSKSRPFLTRCTMIGALVAALMMPPMHAQASGWHFSTGELVLITTVLLLGGGTAIASGVVLISDGIDLFGEPEPTAWNAGWDLALAVPNGVLCAIGAAEASAQDDGSIGMTIAACAASVLLLSHGIWELSLLNEMGPSDESSQESTSLSIGPTLLDSQGSWGLGMVGTF